jgi:hypothetical protein
MKSPELKIATFDRMKSGALKDFDRFKPGLDGIADDVDIARLLSSFFNLRESPFSR